MAGHQMNFENHGSGLLQPCMATGKQRHNPVPVGFQIFRMLFSVTFIVHINVWIVHINIWIINEYPTYKLI
jgi:hypothetical protein